MPVKLRSALVRLTPLPEPFAQTRAALHLLAERVISPAREQATGRIGLRPMHGGFGTPVFGSEEEIWVSGALLFRQHIVIEAELPISSLLSAARFVGVDLQGEDASLEVDEESSLVLGEFYALAARALEVVRSENAELDPSEVQLWPEHFDVATEIGIEAEGKRAGLGGSPGDEEHPEPYLYVLPWEKTRAQGPEWNATGFVGAELSYAALVEAEDQLGVATEFLRGRFAAVQD